MDVLANKEDYVRPREILPFMKATRFTLPIAAASLVLCLCFFPAYAAPTRVVGSTNARAAISEAYAQRERAYKARDFATVLSLYTPDYHSETVNGTPGSLEEVKKRMKRFTAAVMQTYVYSTAYTFGKCTVVGNVATIRVHFVTRETNTATSKHKLTYATDVSDAVDQWLFGSGKWRQKSFIALSNRTTISRTPIANP